MVKKAMNGFRKRKLFHNLSDTNLLLSITIIVFLVMYIGAMVFLKSGFLKPQTFFNILNFHPVYHSLSGLEFACFFINSKRVIKS